MLFLQQTFFLTRIGRSSIVATLELLPEKRCVGDQSIRMTQA